MDIQDLSIVNEPLLEVNVDTMLKIVTERIEKLNEDKRAEKKEKEKNVEEDQEIEAPPEPEPEPEPELVIEEVPIIEVDPKAYEIQKLKDQLAELQTLKELDKEEEAEIIEEVIEAEGE